MFCSDFFINHNFPGGVLMGVLFLLIIIFIIYTLFQDNRRICHKPETAKDILKIQYAKGAISKEEFDSKLKDIL